MFYLFNKMKSTKNIIFLLILSLNIICIELPPKNLETTIENEEEKLEPFEIQLGEYIKYNIIDENYFKYNNSIKENLTVLFSFDNSIESIEITAPDGKTSTQYKYGNGLNQKVVFKEKGLYYFQIFSKRFYEYALEHFSTKNGFTTFIPGEIIDTIDLNKEKYYSNLELESKENYDCSIYKIKNLKENKFVIFNYNKPESFDFDYDNLNNVKPFKICINETDNCESNMTFYHFKKENEYTLYISFVYSERQKMYYYNPYYFFPVLTTTIEYKAQGLYAYTEPKIYNIDLQNTNGLYARLRNYQIIMFASSDEPLTLNNLTKLQKLSWNYTKDSLIKFSNDSKYEIIIVIPLLDESNGAFVKVAIAEHLIEKLDNEEIIIPSKKAAIINLRSYYYFEKAIFEHYNILSIFSSQSQNMRYIYSVDFNNKYDILIDNYKPLPIFIDSSEKDQIINNKIYYPRYAIFSVGNNEIFNLLHDLFQLSLNNRYGNEINSFLPLNIRLNSYLISFYEYFNLYLDNFDHNLNVYIKKFFGESELYECTETFNLKNYSILTTPINYCKNKKPIFNRLFSLKEKTLITGYISHNSYFDIYLEYNDNNKKIQIPDFLKGTINSASKYIKKDETYTVDFTVDHMVKIEIVDNIEVTIYNDTYKIILNKDNPNEEIKGKNFKVKSNSDTMIYFYGRLYEYIKQVKIDPEKKGEYLKINSYVNYLFSIEIGFEGYNPLNIEPYAHSTLSDEYDIYFENLYDKLSNQLVKNEYIFLYYGTYGTIVDESNISYNKSLNNPINDYTFDVIPNNSEEKSLIIYNKFKNKIYYQINYCGEPHDITMYYKGSDKYESMKQFTFNENATVNFDEISEYGTKINFKSDKEFIFSYSFYDKTDKIIDENEILYNERTELTNLEISNITNSGEDKVIKISFKPNYLNSSTKYIIVIAPKSENNNIETFSNPCNIIKLVTGKEKGIKIIKIFEPGLNDIINTEIDISDMADLTEESNLLDKNKYIVGIISQELRFKKKLNFYTPYEFTLKKKDEKKNDSKSLKVGYKILIAIIVVIVAAIIIFVIFYLLKGKRNKSEEINSDKKLLSEF